MARARESKASSRVAVVSKVVLGKAGQRVGLGPACPPRPAGVPWAPGHTDRREAPGGDYGALEQSRRDFRGVRLMSILVPARVSSWRGPAVSCGEVAAVTRVTHSESCSLRTTGSFLGAGSFVSHGKMEAREIKCPPKLQG